MDTVNEKVGEAYGDDYLKWKSWGGQEFGTLKRFESAYYAAEISRTKSRIAAGAKVLEIGFGNGSFLRYAQKRGWDVLGTEVNDALVDVAKQNGFRAIHAEDLSTFDDDTFDLVIAFDILEHIPQDALANFILEVRRILKNGGVFIARFPNGDSPLGLRNQNGDITHITVLGSGKVRYFAKKTNMDLVFIGGQAQPILGTSAPRLIHGVVFLPIKKLINFFVNAMFFPPGANVAFCSSNLTMIFRATKTPPRIRAQSPQGSLPEPALAIVSRD